MKFSLIAKAEAEGKEAMKFAYDVNRNSTNNFIFELRLEGLCVRGLQDNSQVQ